MDCTAVVPHNRTMIAKRITQYTYSTDFSLHLWMSTEHAVTCVVFSSEENILFCQRYHDLVNAAMKKSCLNRDYLLRS